MTLEAVVTNLGPQNGAFGKLTTLFDKLETPDEKTFVMTLKTPYYAALDNLTMALPLGILNNQVVNSSRALHSLKHTVPKSHKNIAIHMVDHIRRLGVFPANYALDLGEFIDSNGNSYIDIVELNPISCSMCYVNNSIYADVVPEIGECQRQLMMGAEFCYDAIANPKNYDMLRISNKSYTYTSDNQYALL